MAIQESPLRRPNQHELASTQTETNDLVPKPTRTRRWDPKAYFYAGVLLATAAGLAVLLAASDGVSKRNLPGQPTAIPDGIGSGGLLVDKRTTAETPMVVVTPPPTETPTSPLPKEGYTKIEGTIDPSKCVFITDPIICAQGQPRTREGMENQITGIEYSNIISGTAINTRKGYFSVVKLNGTNVVVGVSIRLDDGSILNINSNDLDIPNPKSRPVENGDVVAKVGKSGYISFSTGAKENPLTGEYVTPQSFFEGNFPEQVLRKPKKVLPKSTGAPQIGITTEFR